MEDSSVSKARKVLTEAIRLLSNEAESTTPDGMMLTKAQVLASRIWEYALGKTYVDTIDGKRHTIKPQQWAIQLIFERMEGRVPNAIDDGGETAELAERLSELTTNSINEIAERNAEDGEKGTTG